MSTSTSVGLKVPFNAFPADPNADKTMAIAMALREDYTNLAANGATRMLICEAEFSGIYGVLVAHNGNPFYNGNIIENSLHFNTSCGVTGVQGGGMKAACGVLPQRYPNVGEIHLASKTHEEGFQSKYLRYNGTTGEKIGSADITNSDVLTEGSVKAAFGSEYDNYTVFIFRPLEKMNNNRYIYSTFVDAFSIAIDGLNDNIEVTILTRSSKKNSDAAGISPTYALDFFEGGTDFRTNVIPRKKKVRELLPTIASCNTTVNVEVPHNDKQCEFRVTLDASTAVAFTYDSRDQHTRLIYQNEDGTLSRNSNMTTVSNVRSILDNGGNQAVHPELERCYNSPMNANNSLLNLYTSECGIFRTIITTDDSEKIRGLWNKVFELNPTLVLQGPQHNGKPVISARAIFDIVAKIEARNDEAERFLPLTCMDILFLINDSKVKPILREAFRKAMEYDDEFIRYVGESMEFFRDSSDEWASLNATADGRTRKSAIQLNACYTISGKQIGENKESAVKLDDHFTRMKDTVYLYHEDGSPFIKNIAFGSESYGFRVMQNPIRNGQRVIDVSLDTTIDVEHRSAHLFMRDTDGERYVVKGIYAESKKKRKKRNPSGGPGENRADRPYIDLDDESLVGVVKKGRLELNKKHVFNKKLFGKQFSDAAITKAQQHLYQKLNEFAMTVSSRQSEYKIEFSSKEKEDAASVPAEVYVLNSSLAYYYEQIKSTLEQRIEKFSQTDDIGSEDELSKAA